MGKSSRNSPNATRQKLVWLCAVSLSYYTAVTIADTVAQSIFVARLGISALPNIFLLKAAINLLSALAYLPLTRGRNPLQVWRFLLFTYGVTLSVGWWAVTGNTSISRGAYILYVGHEVVWTLAIIHWGIFLLSLLGPLESRRLFPVLFGVGRLGALLGGLLVTTASVRMGTINMLGIVLILALFSALASLKLATKDRQPSSDAEKSDRGSWRGAAASPLVRAIALSTAAMVMLRYGLRMVSLAEIRAAFEGDKDQIAAFLGLIAVLGNAAALVLGIWIVPRLLARIGVGATNLLYASTTLFAFALAWLFPGLATASSARFVEMPLKHALKTPLSVLFYGGTKTSGRAAARSLVFGVAIPLAAITTGLGFRYGRPTIGLISALGVCLSLVYLVVCAWQNRQYERGLAIQLQEAAIVATGDSELRNSWQLALGQVAPRLSQEMARLLANSLASPIAHIRQLAQALAGEILTTQERKNLRDKVPGQKLL